MNIAMKQSELYGPGGHFLSSRFSTFLIKSTRALIAGKPRPRPRPIFPPSNHFFRFYLFCPSNFILTPPLLREKASIIQWISQSIYVLLETIGKKTEKSFSPATDRGAFSLWTLTTLLIVGGNGYKMHRST